MVRRVVTGLVLVVLTFASAVATAERPFTIAIPHRSVPELHLYTMGAGESLFQRFGHAALCLHYPAQPTADICFNYGTTNFETAPQLVWDVLRGAALFWVETTSPRRMVRLYRYLDRDIWRQTLPLTEVQAARAEAHLLRDALPQNRFYRYHHFFDNCTTRLRDIIDAATDGALRRAVAGETTSSSFRELGRRGYASQTWLRILSDFFWGRAADHRPDAWEAMFLPANLRAEVSRQLGAEPEVVAVRRAQPVPLHGLSGRPWIALGALLLTAPIAIGWARGRIRGVSLLPASVVLGALGTSIWLLIAVSGLLELRYNEAVLMFWPTDLLLPLLRNGHRRAYAALRLVSCLLIALLLAIGVLVQPLWVPMLMVLVPMTIVAMPPVPKRRAPSQARAPSQPMNQR